VPIERELPTDGFETLVNPEDLLSSPFGWLSTDNKTQSTTTSGNNAAAFVGQSLARATAVGEFTTEYAVGANPLTASQMNAAVVNAFYVVNTVHDITYRYGFTEAAFNFQTVNVSICFPQ
jgi:extracellular elastinolytic metalloproteinase